MKRATMIKAIPSLAALLMAATVGLSLPAMAAKMPLKSYHKEIFSDDKGNVECSSCHGDSKPYTIPDEDACLTCHGSKEDLAEETERPGHGAAYEPNPHDSLHYGQDLSCVYCHAQHKKTEVYCNNCHEFKYPELKRK
ncbi:cytochrome c3 family protein [Ferrimonas sp. YFM]|uniref:cytochrome c3 family protein n=1 Tax=Ferrimonas sp. YFM TaxID=3028878 RepID=UPI002573D93B|nr:cytochrome c3 family protein [Ferrimonas sp. YFM]BDY06848.1 cytochrome c [Ferrimonas sp. YFM]